jgi:hypothetical protein
MRLASTAALLLAALAIAAGASPSPALAAPQRDVMRTDGVICKAAGLVSGLIGTACKVASHPKTVITVGKKLLSGDPGGALKGLLGGSSGAGRAVAAAAGLAAVVAWVTGGAHAALQETAKLIDTSSRPNLVSTWFSRAYWRVAGVSALLTLPFLFAAAIQALLRSDMTLLGRAAFGYLPLGMLAVGVAGPITMLLLGASDEMSAIVSSAAGHADGSFLAHADVAAGAVGAAAISPFVAFFVALLTVAATITLWLELLIREAAVYVIVLMLPLFFAALVWPARRIWAVRAVELLIALILSKFAIVAVLALGGAALDHAAALSVSSLLGGLTLVLLAAFSPWALLRLLPLHEMASAAAGGLRTASAQPLFNSDERASQLAGSAMEQDGVLPGWLQQAARNRRRDDSLGDDVRALLPAYARGDEGPVSEERVESAGEQAAAAVAASGGGSVGEPGSSSQPPTPPVEGAAPSQPPAPAVEGAASSHQSQTRRHFSAPGLESLSEHFHGEGDPQRLDALDPERLFFDAGAKNADNADVKPPTLPDPEPRPPATPSDEDQR